MRRGYIRISKAGPGLEEQRNVLQSAGIEDFSELGPVYVDEISRRRNSPHLPERDRAILSLDPGDELVVACAARLGTSASDVLTAIEAIGRRSAAVYDAETKQAITWHPDAIKALEFAQRAESQSRKELAAKMRRARLDTGQLGGKPVKFTGKLRTEAEQLWSDPALSAEEVAERIGVGVRTLYRHLGVRGSN